MYIVEKVKYYSPANQFMVVEVQKLKELVHHLKMRSGGVKEIKINYV